MKHYIEEIEAALAKFPARTSKQVPESYIGGGQSKLRFIGLKVPQMQQAWRTGFSFSGKAPNELAAIWDYIWWNSDCYEVMSFALGWFGGDERRQLLPRYWPQLKKWSARIDNWAHSDTLSSLYARLHEDDPALVFTTFKKWNVSKNPWLRRLSIVSLFYYSSQRKRMPPLKKVTTLLKPQLEFDHYYVQKGVGWTLREAGNVYPTATYKFIESNIQNISSVAFSAATEKMSKAQKQKLKNLR